MSDKLTPRQKAQLAVLETLPPKFQQMHRLIADEAGHRAIAAAMKFADHSEVELERLKAERESEKKRRSVIGNREIG